MSVPAHTRIDSHPNGDVYELWSQQYGKVNIARSDFISTVFLNHSFDNLATFSSNNFFSKNSVVNTKKFDTKKEIINGKEKSYFTNSLGGTTYRICVIDNTSIKSTCKITDDFKLNLDYWNMLSPQAVGYSAGVLDYFAKKFAEIDKARPQLGFVDSLIAGAENFATSRVDSLKYDLGQKIITNGDALRSIWGAGKALAVETLDFGGLMTEAAVETTVNTAQMASKATKTAVEQGKELGAKTAETAAKTVDQVVKKGKVLGSKIVAITAKPAQASAKALPEPKLLVEAPVKQIIKITPLLAIFPPADVTAPLATPTVSSLKKKDGFLVIGGGRAESSDILRLDGPATSSIDVLPIVEASSTATSVDPIILPPEATSTASSSEAVATSTEEEATSTPEEPQPIVCSELSYDSDGYLVTQTLLLAKSPYCIEGNPTLPAGATLTIEPGVFVKFKVGSALDIVGTLVSVGSSAKKIYFTSYNDHEGGDLSESNPHPSDWKGVVFESGSVFESGYTVMRYGGGGIGFAAMKKAKKPKAKAMLAMQQFFLTGPIIRFIDSTANISHLEIYYNSGGVIAEGNSVITIANSLITDSIFAQGNSSVMAENNWWGDRHGPNYFDMESGYSSASAFGNIDFDPWLTVEPAW
ncbi:hypothetical protein HGA64_05525 [Candidatus Falkowbacteria bacterium]|nr:hypothetical protein [Candidatus Falkowbacteria bacterium]